MKRGLLNSRVIFVFLGIIICIGMFLSYGISSKAHEIESDTDVVQFFESNNDIDIDCDNPKSGLKIAIMNDFHYFSQALYSDCEGFHYDVKAEKKMLLESDAILNKAIEEVKKQSPDVIFVGGDMSKDGEKINHETVAKKLEVMEEELQKSGLNTQIYVINGNHDINSNARDYSSGQTVTIPSVTPSEFKEIYKNLGYGSESEFYSETPGLGGGLSYVTDVGKGFTLIAVDTNRYTKDQTKTGKDEAEVDGMISDDLLNWIQIKAKEAYDKGNTPIVLQHHAITKHFGSQEIFGKSFIVDDYEKICDVYIKAGIHVVFTGHTHASDIAKVDTDKGTVYDIMTSSLVGLPVSTRTVNLSVNENNQDSTLRFATDVHFYDEIDYIDARTGKNITDIQMYAYEKDYKSDSFRTMMSKTTVENFLEKIKNGGGIKGELARALKVDEEQVTDEIVKLAIKQLSNSENEAKELKLSKFTFGVYYNNEKDAIYLKQKTKKFDELALEVYIPINELKLLIEDMYDDIDQNIINNPDEVYAVFEKVIDSAETYKIMNGHTAFDYYKYLYTYYKVGIVSSAELYDDYTEDLYKSNKCVKKFLKNVFYKSCKKEMSNLLSYNKLDLERILKVGNNSVTSKVVVKVITSSFDDLSDVWTKIVKRIIVSDKVADMGTDLMLYISEGMGMDSDVPEDNGTIREVNLNKNI